VLIVGTGPMGRITAEDLIKRGRRKVAGFLRFEDEQRPDNLRAPFLGTAAELENILRTVPVSEVYVAGRNHPEAMQAAIKSCEKFGIPSRSPPTASAWIARARWRARRSSMATFISLGRRQAQPDGAQAALRHRLLAVALWMLLPLFGMVSLVIKLTSRGRCSSSRSASASTASRSTCSSSARW